MTNHFMNGSFQTNCDNSIEDICPLISTWLMNQLYLKKTFFFLNKNISYFNFIKFNIHIKFQYE